MATTFKLRRAFFAQAWRHATALASCVRSTIDNLQSTIATHRALLATTVAVALTANIASTLATYPHTLSYFNEISGGSLNGATHLLDGNLDWGQDLLFLKAWHDAHPEARPMHLAWFGRMNPRSAGFKDQQAPHTAAPLPENAFNRSQSSNTALAAGWHGLSVNELHGYKCFDRDNEQYASLRSRPAKAHAGYSVQVYVIP